MKLQDQRLSALLTIGFINRLVQAADGLAYVIAAVIAWAFLGQIAFDADENLTLVQSLVLSALALAFHWRLGNGLNDFRVARHRVYLQQLVTLAISLGVGGIAVAVVALAFTPPRPAFHWFWVWALVTFAALALTRLLATELMRSIERRGMLIRRVAIFGVTEEAEVVMTYLSQPDQRLRYKLIGMFDQRAPDRSRGAADNLTVDGNLAELENLAKRGAVDVIIVTIPWAASERIREIQAKLRALHVDLLMPFETSWISFARARSVRIGGWPFLELARRPLKGTSAALKVVEDYVVAGVAVLLLAPVMLVCAIAVKLDSPGPALFRQRRIGFNGQVFDMFKFRSMTVDPTDDGSVGTTADNPRITRVGSFLRRTSLDELPQLFNVLRGEMSCVGPRAHVPGMLVADRRYFEMVQEYAARHRVKPGITGWAQINGMRGGIHDEEKARRGVDLDLEYIENWTLWFDFRIMIQTVVGGIAGRDVF
jgi:Undecaprenyl-phosphate glucose phosphotransferase